jgi:hypothetical protein
MRVFDHPNMDRFCCPICGESDDKPVVLIGISGTEEGRNMQAEQVHFGCLENLRYYKSSRMIVAATVV